MAGLCLSIPYLVIVVAMGYSRQGVAIGVMMPGLLAFERGRLRPFCFRWEQLPPFTPLRW